MTETEKQGICLSLGGKTEVQQGKYLGLPTVVTTTKDQIFGFIREGDWKVGRISCSVLQEKKQC